MLRNLMRAAPRGSAVRSRSGHLFRCIRGRRIHSGTCAGGGPGRSGTANVFEVTNTKAEFVKVKCSEATFEGEDTVLSATTFTVTPNYEGCTLGGLAATVSMNGCKLSFNSVSAQTASVDIIGCIAGKKITVVKRVLHDQCSRTGSAVDRDLHERR
jgi:hypothetical protein